MPIWMAHEKKEITNRSKVEESYPSDLQPEQQKLLTTTTITTANKKHITKMRH